MPSNKTDIHHFCAIKTGYGSLANKIRGGEEEREKWKTLQKGFFTLFFPEMFGHKVGDIFI
jgi:hypothetical protein